MFKILLAGSLPVDRQLRREAEDLFNKIRETLSPESSAETSPKSSAETDQEQIWMLVSPFFTDISWIKWAEDSGLPVKCITAPGTAAPNATQSVCLHTNQRDFIAENLCADADLMLAVWDESPDAMEGAVLELLRMARRKKLPCIWLSERTGRVFWPEETLYMPFSVSKLQKVCRKEALPLIRPEIPDRERAIPLLRLGMVLYARYLKKHKAVLQEAPPVQDDVLKADFRLKGKYSRQEPVRKRILEEFDKFDQAAIALNSRYQGAVYWQAILPFIITCFLALGFYVETIFGAFSVPAVLLQVLAGIGFLMNAWLNLYKNRLDHSKRVRKWQDSFLEYRGMAELLRVLAHFIPFGISVNIRDLCADDPALYKTTREIISDDRPGTTDVDQDSAKQSLHHLKEMVADQLAYHQKSVRRYSTIVEKLSRWSSTVCYVGFIFVVLRALFKFGTLISPIPQSPLGNTTVKAFADTGANMLAMMIPAWAAYFSSKLSQCSFKYNLDNHQNMVLALRQIDEQIQEIEETFPDVPLEYVSSLGESVARTMLEADTSMWIRRHRAN